MAYNENDPTSDVNLVRLLINDTTLTRESFTEAELQAFLDMEGGSVKLAAAQAMDTIADNEALTSKVIRDGKLATDGAKLADSLRKRAETLRAQVDQVDEGVFDVIDMQPAYPQPFWGG